MATLRGPSVGDPPDEEDGVRVEPNEVEEAKVVTAGEDTEEETEEEDEMEEEEEREGVVGAAASL